MRPEKCSFEDGIDGRGWPRMASEVLLGFTVRLMLIDNMFSCTYNPNRTENEQPTTPWGSGVGADGAPW